jgi:hypothetical protein
MLPRPEPDLLERRDERAPAVGQRVGHGDRRPVVDGARDESGGGQVGEPVGEYGIGDAADRAREVAEPGAAQRASTDAG